MLILHVSGHIPHQHEKAGEHILGNSDAKGAGAIGQHGIGIGVDIDTQLFYPGGGGLHPLEGGQRPDHVGREIAHQNLAVGQRLGGGDGTVCAPQGLIAALGGQRIQLLLLLGREGNMTKCNLQGAASPFSFCFL